MPSNVPHRIGLVLGAGGATGAAFHAGTLLALEHDAGWNPNGSAVIVGSSAGSIVAGLLRAGLSADDLAAWATSVDALPAGRASRVILDDIRSTRHRVAPSIPRPPMPSVAWLGNVRRPSQVKMHTVALSLLPHGWVDAATNLARFGSVLETWPEQPLWISAVRRSDARRVMFGRDSADVSPGRAIAASCAIPGMFKPVTIAGHSYIDGGAHSLINADVLLDADVDVAIVLSPMSARAGSKRRPDRLLREIFHRRAHNECERLSRAGLDVHLFEPDSATLDVMGINALDVARTPRVVRDAFLAAGHELANNHSLRWLLTSRAQTPEPASPPGRRPVEPASGGENIAVA